MNSVLPITADDALQIAGMALAFLKMALVGAIFFGVVAIVLWLTPSGVRAYLGDSPVFWLLLFGIVAIGASQGVQGKYLEREDRRIRMRDAQERVAIANDQGLSHAEDVERLYQTDQAERTFSSLTLVLEGVMGVGLMATVVHAWRRRSQAAGGELPRGRRPA
jgi:hypothetical protein